MDHENNGLELLNGNLIIIIIMFLLVVVCFGLQDSNAILRMVHCTLC